MMQWLNEPPQWNDTGDTITVTAGAQTDFWRVTRHGFIADNGHFYYREVTGDFTVSVQFAAQYQVLYDQAGLMVRLNEKTWCKCGIEYVESVAFASAVVTRDFSDWSVAPLAAIPDAMWFKLQRIGSAIEVSYALDGVKYTMLREAYLTEAPALQIGVMCAAPKGNGFDVTFRDFKIES